MTNKKNIASKLVLALFILTLISCCLLGSTFARYASGGSGTASVGVAEWDVSITDSATQNFSTDKLSPSMAEFNGESARQNTTGKELVATITSNSDVDALVTVTATDLGIALEDGSQFDATGYTKTESGVSGNGASAAQISDLFTLVLYTDDSDTCSDGKVLANGGTFEIKANSNKTVYVFAEVIWTSADKDSNGDATNAAYADTIDTWAGMYVESVGCTLTYSAVQNSTRPTT